MQFQYNSLGQLATVIDTLGRPVSYSYNSTGLLTSVTDYTGRTLHLGYDAQGDLVAVTSPAVTGTPNGNDFPDGKTEQYTYSDGYPVAALNHEMLTDTAPNEVATGGPPGSW